ncbi:MAG TPA: hypothetical protein VFW33_15430 [Gemmataceae bacterium]|nr:hypothetical protein [Gemmataceae bacterium]
MPKSRSLILPLALALLGCGDNKGPAPDTKPETPATPRAVAAVPAPEATEKAPPKDSPPPRPSTPGWTQQLKEMTFPAAPVAGKIGGKPFAPQVIELSRVGGRFLTLRQGEEFNPDLQVKVALSADKGENFSGKTYEIAPDSGVSPVSVSVARKAADGELPEVKTYPDKLALRLEFGQEDGGKLPGKIYLCLPDPSQGYVAGTFAADLEPDYTKPPRPDEVPCVGGKIALKGRDEYNLVAGLVGQTAQGATVTNLAGTIVTPKGETSVSSAPYPPQRSTLVNDPEAGCVYRHSRLAPGRYLVFAGAGDRYIDWRWVEVRDKAPLTIDFTVEPDAAGTLEVALPKDAKGSVQLIPLDEAGKLPDVKEALPALSLALKTDVPAKDGKVTLDGLRPGNYRATFGGAAKDVTIKAKETVKVDLSSP